MTTAYVPKFETTTAHHPSCVAEQAWDIPEAYDRCTCGEGKTAFYPRRVCTTCWRMPHQHAKDCQWKGRR